MEKLLAGICCFLLLGFTGYCQSLYSDQGLGSLEHQGTPYNLRMGEIGIGTPSIWHVNTQNPANLVYNRFSTFQVGVEVESRNFTTEDINGSDVGGGLRFLGYAFPILPGKWSSPFGILPLSTVSFNTFTEGTIDGTEATLTTDERGEGGLTSLYWANGFAIKKKFFVGIRSNFTFGSIENQENKTITETFLVEDDEGEEQEVEVLVGNVTQILTKESYSDVNFQFGLGYNHQLSETKYLNFGMTYSPKSLLNGTADQELIRLDGGDNIENQEVSTFDVSQDLPQSFGYGMSYQKANHYIVGIDVEFQQWSDIQNSRSNFNDFFKVAVGAEWTPDWDNVNSYFSRAKYSIGFNRTRLPYIVNDQALTDFGINFGASFPVSSLSSLDLGFKWGQLGEATNGLVRENYFEIVLGATINDRWFIKRRYD